MQGAGVGTGGVRRIVDGTVGLYLIDLDRGERSFTFWRSASAARLLAPDAGWLAGQLDGAALLLLSGITVAVVPEDRPALVDAIAAARSGGTIVAFDPNIRPRLWLEAATMREALEALAGVSDILLPSFEDEARHFGDADPDATVARYRALGARTVVVRNGRDRFAAWDAEAGVAIHDPAPVEVGTRPRPATRSTRASWLRGEELAAALRAGATLSGHVCRYPGALVPPE
jgi:2-dehydro-3-deoxygluconokinase